MNIYAINQLVDEVATHLAPTVDNNEGLAQRNAWWLIEKLTGMFEAELLAQYMIILTPEQEDLLGEWVHLRVEEKLPLQYILGYVPFINVDIFVESPILIPRPETEEIVAWLIDRMTQAGDKKLGILDVCSGSGCISLALAKAFPESTVTGLDINPQAISLANKNKKANRIKNATFITSDLFKNLPASFDCDIIISNPPYLSAASYERVSDEIRRWEDPKALIADEQGMIFYRKIAQYAYDYFSAKKHVSLVPCLVFEIGIDQDNLSDILKTIGFNRVELYHDLQGMPRWIAAWITT